MTYENPEASRRGIRGAAASAAPVHRMRLHADGAGQTDCADRHSCSGQQNESKKLSRMVSRPAVGSLCPTWATSDFIPWLLRLPGREGSPGDVFEQLTAPIHAHFT